MGERTRRRWLVPEVVQTSAMDCGPATLKCLLEGHGVRVSYGRLREACQTDVDGTSIDTLEDVAVQLGLAAEQTILPPDHLLLPEAEALPAIAVVRSPSGITHFVVVWRRHGRFVQVMDPAIGRRWVPAARLLDDLYRHRMPIPLAAWRDHADSDAHAVVLAARLRGLGLTEAAARRRIATAREDADWMAMARLDAATRMLTGWLALGALRRGSRAEHLLDRFCADANVDAIPDGYWSVVAAPPDETGEAHVELRGAVLVRIVGVRSDHLEATDDPEGTERAPLPPELVSALSEPPARPGRALLGLLREDGVLGVGVLLVALAIAAFGLVFEGVLFRGLLDLAHDLGTREQKVWAALALAMFGVGLLALELPMVAVVLRLGRHLEVRARAAFLAKIPRLHDRYFESRLKSDMAERCHSVHMLRNLPVLAAEALRAAFALVLTTAGIAWLDPHGAWLAIAAAVLLLALPAVVQPLLAERDLRLRTHVGALSRFYLDAMLGLVPVRAHGAERAVRREHENRVVQWRIAATALVRAMVTAETLQAFGGTVLAIALLVGHLVRGGSPGTALLLVYWALSLPVLAQQLALVARQYPTQRAVILRLLEPLGAPEEPVAAAETPDDREGPAVALELRGVTVRAGGHTILEEIDVRIDAGTHVAIVGASGAGKSTLVGLLLGWHRAAHGEVLVDGHPLAGERQARLRNETAWVDPTVQLWNRSLLDNLRYGTSGVDPERIGEAVVDAALQSVLERLPDGLQTRLGESGALVSGGEGQRVRLGRAFLRPRVRLAVLDEPFRGLDREHRRRLLQRARTLWSDATLLCITHDVGETLGFSRVLVLEGGRIVEDGEPAALARDPATHYAGLLALEDDVRDKLWTGPGWRRVWMRDGKLAPEAARA